MAKSKNPDDEKGYVRVIPPIRRDAEGKVIPSRCDVRIDVRPDGDSFKLDCETRVNPNYKPEG